jgi:hypothetical protein
MPWDQCQGREEVAALVESTGMMQVRQFLSPAAAAAAAVMVVVARAYLSADAAAAVVVTRA